ncbi:MAG: pitrilysin family protein, partial [Parvularculaceae bacterium]
PAVPTLTAALMNKGTANKATAELEDAIKSLGSEVSIFSNTSGTFVTGSTLARNFDATIALAQEMLLEPRWDTQEFDILMLDATNTIDQNAANPSAIANRELAQIMYPADNIYSVTGYGAKDKLSTVTLDDLKAFYADNFTPVGAKFRVVGDISPKKAKQALGALTKTWVGDANPALEIPFAPTPTGSKVYFYDIPGAKQSVFRLGRPALAATDDDFFKAQAMNYLLGDIYTSKLNTELRVNKGYTYGIGSGFTGGEDRGRFRVFTSVRTNVTLESAQLIKDILTSYGPDFTQDDLTTMKSALIKGQALATETLSAKLGMIGEISAFGYGDDFKAKNAAAIGAMTLDEFKALTGEYLRPDEMHYVIVGDAKTQSKRMKDLGFGKPVMLEAK